MSSPTSKEDNATTIGLGTGLGVGLPLLLALCVSLWLLYRAQKKIKALGSRHQTVGSEPRNQDDINKWQPTQEIDGRHIHEVPAVRP